MLIVLASRFSLILAKGMSALQPSPYFGLIQTWSVVSGTKVYPIIRRHAAVWHLWWTMWAWLGTAREAESWPASSTRKVLARCGVTVNTPSRCWRVLSVMCTRLRGSMFNMTVKGVNKTVP